MSFSPAHWNSTTTTTPNNDHKISIRMIRCNRLDTCIYVHGTGIRQRKVRVKLHVTEKRTDKNEQKPGIEFGAFSLKIRHPVAIILMIFLIINWPNFVYLLVDPGNFITIPWISMNHLASFPIGWTSLADTCPFVRVSEFDTRDALSIVVLVQCRHMVF